MPTFRSLLGSAPLSLDAGLLVLRLFFGLALALAHGAGKVANLDQFTQGVARAGVPLAEVLAPLAMLSELVGGLLLAIGLATRPAAVLVFVTMIVAGLHIHSADPFAKKELAFAYAAVAATLFLTGPGRYSLDARIRRR